MTRTAFVSLVLAVTCITACQEAKSPTLVVQNPIPDSAQQLMFGVTFKLTDGGVLRAEVEADTALSYGENTRFELKHVKMIFYTATGTRDATLTSVRGTHNVRVGSMEATGNVVVVSANGKKLETQQLKFDPTRNEVSSDSAFVLTDAQGVTSGVGFVSDPKMTQVRILRAAKHTGREVSIPKR
jgi:LPS export ABC transporter protein LptC